jgi:hypothetical protein
VTFLAKQILDIPMSQIVIEIIFNLARILIALQRCYLQVENLERIITIVKTWLDDLHINCMPNKTMKDYLKVEGSLADDNYELIEEEKHFEDPSVDGD